MIQLFGIPFLTGYSLMANGDARTRRTSLLTTDEAPAHGDFPPLTSSKEPAFAPDVSAVAVPRLWFAEVLLREAERQEARRELHGVPRDWGTRTTSRPQVRMQILIWIQKISNSNWGGTSNLIRARISNSIRVHSTRCRPISI